MGHRVSPEVRDALLALLDRGDRMAGSALGRLEGDKETARLLLDRLTAQPKDRVVIHALHDALGMISVPEVAPKLMEMLGRGYDEEFLIVRTVSNIGGAAEMEQLVERLGKGPILDSTRREIELALRQHAKSPGLLDKVAELVVRESTPAEARLSLVQVLVKSEKPEHAALVRKIATSDADERARHVAIQGLGELGDPESAKILLEMAQSGSDRERYLAQNALNLIRSPETINGFADSYGGLQPIGKLSVMAAAARMPGRIDERLVGIARETAIRDDDVRIRTTAARVLGVRGRDDNVEALATFLTRSTTQSEWTAAVSALRAIGTKKAIEEGMSGLRVVPNERLRQNWMRELEQEYDKIRAFEAALASGR
jgi:HEAT repeat protein